MLKFGDDFSLLQTSWNGKTDFIHNRNLLKCKVHNIFTVSLNKT